MNEKKKGYRKTVSFKTNEVDLYNFLVSKEDYSGYIKSLIKHAKTLEDNDIDILTFGLNYYRKDQTNTNDNQLRALIQLLKLVTKYDNISSENIKRKKYDDEFMQFIEQCRVV